MIYFQNKTVHFIGIGGVGMSAIAESLQAMGIKTQGSNNVENDYTKRLKQKGIPVFIGQKDGSALKTADVVIISSAIQADNPELMAAREQGLPIGHRSEMLAQLMRYKQGIAVAGTHGKTTTTAMIAQMLETGRFDASFIVGGIVNAMGTNAKIGSSDWMVVEADESDGSFLRLNKTVSVVTNIDEEHMDFYGSFDNMKQAYLHFLRTTSFYGFCVMCSDHPVVKSLVPIVRQTRRVITYGLNSDADIYAYDVKVEPARLTFNVCAFGKKVTGFELHLFGQHNVLNALVAIAIGLEMKMSWADIQKALILFGGVQRRFTPQGVFRGISIYDDYAHHPVEIEAVLKAAKEAVGDKKVIAVFQPHRYTRAQDLWNSFGSAFRQADVVIVADVYAAGEKPIEGIDREEMVKNIQKSGHACVVSLQDKKQLATIIQKYATSGDLVIGLGAGDISKWMHDLVTNLQQGEAK